MTKKWFVVAGLIIGAALIQSVKAARQFGTDLPGLQRSTAGARAAASVASTPITIVGSTQTFSDAGGVASKTSDALNTTGANLFIVLIEDYNRLSSSDLVSDSKSNSYTLIITTNNQTGDTTGIWYAYNGASDASHTFTVTGSFHRFQVLAVAGAASTVDPLVSSARAVIDAAATTIGVPSVTPNVGGSLIVTNTASLGAESFSINLGFTINDQGPFIGGRAMAGASAWFVQGAAAAIAPTWTGSLSNTRSTCVAVFKPQP